MSDTISAAGHCLCGAVRFEASLCSPEVDVCHCGMCQRWAAGPFLAVGIEANSLRIEGADELQTYPSSEWGERLFCRKCGTPLFWRTRDGRYIAASAGSLIDKSQLRLAREIYVDEKPAYYDFANATVRLTGQEALQMFMGAGSDTACAPRDETDRNRT